MLQFLKDLPIKFKISGFVIPSTIAFGLMMTFLALYFLNDYKTTSLEEFQLVIEKVLLEDSKGSSKADTQNLIQELSVKADEKIQSMAILLVSIVAGVIVLATFGAVIISSLIGNPVKRAATGLENISSGDADLTQRLPVTANDETGKVSKFFNKF